MLSGNDVAYGSSGNDELQTFAGNDTLDGKGGADAMVGGLGDDLYKVDNPFDLVTENAGEGIDRVETALTAYSLTDNVDNLTYTGAAAFAGTGNLLGNRIVGAAGRDTLNGGDGNDTLIGNAGNDSLDGGAGDDSLVGGAGDDVYVVDSVGDTVVEAAASGSDRVDTDLGSYTLGANVENLSYTGAAAFSGLGNALNNVLTGGDGNDSLSGDAGNDTLNGGAGDDTLLGGAGTDSLLGGLGDDTYVIDVLGDVVVESMSAGTDRVEVAFAAAATYVLTANVEDAVVTGSVTGINLTGNALDNVLAGNAQANVLLGAAGNDSLLGLAGNDTLDGGSGDDTLVGGSGDDLYKVDSLSDVVTESASEGTDRVETVLGAYSLATIANVENLTYTGAAAFAGTGNTLDNSIVGAAGKDTLSGGDGNDTLIGNAGNDSLDGGAGDDSLVGGLGDDVYVVDSENDVVVEAAAGGTDWIETTLSTYSLEALANVEKLTYTGADAFTGTGNTAANAIVGADGDDTLTGGAGNDTLTGNDGNDSLNGGAGTDSLVGGSGDDAYVVDVATDVVVETLNGGNDRVEVAFAAAGTYVLTTNVENASVTGTASGINVSGNDLANALTGNALANSLLGAAGDDSLSGLAGNDTLDGGVGNDSLDGGAGNDSLLGGDGNDVLNAGTGGDTVDGGADTDTLVLLGAFDSYTRTRPTDNDLRLVNADTHEDITVRNVESFSFGGTNMALNEVLANAITPKADSWVGADDIDDTVDGLAGNDTLAGLGGNDTLIGGVGNDSLIGGLGNDVYVVDVAGDVIFEKTYEGTDRVEVAFTAAGTYILSDNVENAAITTATGGVNITGNASDNTLTGNAAANILAGNAGNDSLDGGAGNDTLFGGDGNDTLFGGAGTDSLVGGTGDDTYFLDVAADIVSEGTGAGTDLVNLVFTTAGSYTMTANVENVTVMDSVARAPVAVNVTGNELANTITGNLAANTLAAGAGDDTIKGGGGNDTIDGGLGTDTVALSGVLTDYAISRPTTTQTIFTYLPNSSTTTLTNVEYIAFNDGNANSVTLASLIAQIGSIGNDTLTGGSTDDTLAGGLGNDSLLGGAGNDDLQGGDGADTLTGGAGNDIIDGGAGSDLYLFDIGDGDDIIDQNDALSASVDTLEIGANVGNYASQETTLSRGWHSYNDLVVTVNSTATNGDDVVDHLVVNDFFLNDLVNNAGAIDQIRFATDGTVLKQPEILAELLKGTSGDDWLRGYANTNDSISGGAGDDQIGGAAGNDTLDGGLGNDTLSGDEGNDSLLGGAGNDLLLGGAGNDTLAGGNNNDTLRGGEGSDTYLFNVGNGQDIISDSAGDADVLSFGVGIRVATTQVARSGDDLLIKFGDTPSDQVQITDYFAGAGGLVEQFRFADGGTWSSTAILAKALVPTEGDDYIAGYLGSETLLGLGGDDTINGGAGNDTINGGLGSDLLTGGAGADRFVFDKLDAPDTITDFTSGSDKIGLSKAMFGLSGAVGVTTNLTGLGGHFAYDEGSGALTYDADGSGGSDPLVVALIGVGKSLGNDFLVVA